MVTEAGTGPTIRLAFDHELGAYRAAKQAGDPVAAWRALERAHIVSQTHLPIHMRVHLADRARYPLRSRRIARSRGSCARQKPSLTAMKMRFTP